LPPTLSAECREFDRHLSLSGQALTGNGLANVITGGAGNDVLDGGAGADQLAGGLGNDVYFVDSGDSVVEAANAGTDEVRTALAAYALAAEVERLTGTSAGGQALTGNGLANIITGGAGNDVLDGAAGADQLAGGLGNDVYIVDSGDTISEAANAGTDEVRTALAAYTLGGDLEDLTGTSASGQALTGNGVANRLTGAGGNDILDGGAGADQLAGGLGNDLYLIDEGDSVIEASGAGTDEVRTALAAYTLGANVEKLTGTSGAGQSLTGNGLANSLTGGLGNDILDGGAGNDRLDGGSRERYGALRDGRGGRHGDPQDAGRSSEYGRGRPRHPGRHRAPHRLVLRRYADRQRLFQRPGRPGGRRHDARQRRRRRLFRRRCRRRGRRAGRAGRRHGLDVAGRLQPCRHADRAARRRVRHSPRFPRQFGPQCPHRRRRQRRAAALRRRQRHGAGRRGQRHLIFFIGSLTAADVVNGGADTTPWSAGPYGGADLERQRHPDRERLDPRRQQHQLRRARHQPLRLRPHHQRRELRGRGPGPDQRRGFAGGEDFTFNGSAETDASFVVYGGKGKDTLTGGLGNDIFFYAEDRFATGDTVNGGAGYDGMFLRGNYTIDFNAPGYTGLFTSIENLTLTSATDERYARGGGTASSTTTSPRRTRSWPGGP
jgi:Ca2+-binding RTX toxin-like protein